MATKTISKKTGQGSEQFQLRLPDGMRKHLARAAERNGRSMNAEIVHALAEYFENQDAAPGSKGVPGSAQNTGSPEAWLAMESRLSASIEAAIREANQQQTLELVKKITQSPAVSRPADDMVERLDRAIASKKK